MQTKVAIALHLYIYQSKALFKPMNAHHKILILLQGHFAIYKKHSSISKAEQCQIVWTILDPADFLSPHSYRLLQNIRR